MSFQNKPYSTSSKQPLRTTPSTHTRSSPSSSHHQFSSQSNQNNQQQNNNGINLTSDQISEIKESFNLFDMDKDGKLNYHELKVAMKALGFELKKFEVIQILKDANSSSNSKGGGGNGGGEGSVGGMMIDEERFMEVMERMISERDPMEELLRAFKLFDQDNTGKISLANLRKVAQDLGETLGDLELQAMIDEFDMDGDHQISHQEFMQIMQEDP